MTPNPNEPARPRFTPARVAALGCSIALVAAFILYRTGGKSIMSSTKSGRVAPVEQTDGKPTLSEEFDVMSSTKSGPIVPTTRAARRVMPGSKSAVLTEPVRDITVAQGDATAQPSTQPTRP